MRTCGTCQHWQREHNDWFLDIRLTLDEGETAEDRYDYDGAHQERVRRAEQSYGLCGAIVLHESYEEINEAELPLAFTLDGSGYKARLFTQAPFGCPLWTQWNTASSTDQGTTS